jgi:hypothetical protein
VTTFPGTGPTAAAAGASSSSKTPSAASSSKVPAAGSSVSAAPTFGVQASTSIPNPNAGSSTSSISSVVPQPTSFTVQEGSQIFDIICD